MSYENKRKYPKASGCIKFTQDFNYLSFVI